MEKIMKMRKWKLWVMSLVLFLLLTVCNCANGQLNNNDRQIVEADSLTDVPIDGTLRPDINRMTMISTTTNVEKPNSAKQLKNDEILKISTIMPGITDGDNTSKFGHESSFEPITLSSSPSSISTSTSTEKRESISNEPETEQESTDERPPALPTINENADDRSLSYTGDYSTPYTHPSEMPKHDPMYVERQVANKHGLFEMKLFKVIAGHGYYKCKEQNINVTPENLITTLAPNQQNNDLRDTVGSGNAAGGKINIADLYPVKDGDFNPIIKQSNEKLIKTKNDYLKDSYSERFENNDNKSSKQIFGGLFENHENNNNNNDDEKLTHLNSKTDEIGIDNNFTGKLLQDDDGVITEIEKKFQLDDLRHSVAVTSTVASTSTSESSSVSSSKTILKPTALRLTKKPIAVNHKIEFIDRRVKKSFDFPMHKYERPIDFGHVDFANTKFNTELVNKNENSDAHPEFSTTKFYNSKELYNEMLHKKHTLTANRGAGNIHLMEPFDVTRPILSTTTKANNLEKYKKVDMQIIPINTGHFEESTQNMQTITTQATTQHDVGVQKPKTQTRSQQEQKMLQTSQTSTSSGITSTQKYETTSGHNDDDNDETTPFLLQHAVPAGANEKSLDGKHRTKNIQKSTENLMNTMQTITKTVGIASSVSLTTTDTTDLPSSSSSSSSSSSASTSLSPSSSTSSSFSPSSSSEIGTVARAKVEIPSDDSGYLSSAAPSSTPLQALKPISRPRVLTRIWEKMNALDCDIQNLIRGSHAWRGNETHELMLPTMTPENCRSSECMPMVISWEGYAEIQSGDVLLVEINDSLLYPTDNNQTFANVAHTILVYQVTRPGHEHCDITEGVLLDITPLVVDGKKLVTLYDKDLTEGINLLIVVSELWGAQCIRLKVLVKSDNCGENADCSGKGVCFSNEAMEGYECQCCNGFAGPHCEEIDACSPSPCTNNGICVDLSQGHEGNAYQCLCPYGYTGKNCQYESDPCNPIECLNGGSCVGNSTHFRCDCAPGYTGPLCQHNLNECESSPCVHGICVDQEDGFRCFCQPGFAGELCDFEYNECESNPCLNSAECIDRIGGFECKCSKGYTGNRCQIKVDFCANGPCPNGHRCIDHGNDFSCECPGGRDGPDCNQIPRTQCNVNPCANGGTCWTSGDSFYCACRPGYTGKMCEDEFVVETVVSSSEFMVDDTNARDFTDKNFGTVVLKSPVELHNAYIAAGVLAAAIFIVAIVVTICHCKVNQTYRKFSNRQTAFFPILGFGKRSKSQKSNRHWLSGKSTNNSASNNSNTGNNLLKSTKGHLPGTGSTHYHNHPTGGGIGVGGGNVCGSYNCGSQLQQHGQSIHDRPFQRHLAMNLENDMYYTVDFSESQHSPLIQ